MTLLDEHDDRRRKSRTERLKDIAVQVGIMAALVGVGVTFVDCGVVAPGWQTRAQAAVEHKAMEEALESKLTEESTAIANGLMQRLDNDRRTLQGRIDENKKEVDKKINDLVHRNYQTQLQILRELRKR